MSCRVAVKQSPYENSALRGRSLRNLQMLNAENPNAMSAHNVTEPGDYDAECHYTKKTGG
jgi:hypothetical protein